MISGPSGAGKGTLVARVRAQRPDLGLTVSATTREPRTGEVDGVNYFFLTEDEFSARIKEGAFIEWAQVHDHRYGTLASEIERNLSTGHSLMLEIDVQGALAVKKRFPEAVLIFIEPPSLEVLKERLIKRGSETPESVALRLKTAEGEMPLRDRYDEILVNDDLDRATDEFLAVLYAHERNGSQCLL